MSKKKYCILVMIVAVVTMTSCFSQPEDIEEIMEPYFTPQPEPVHSTDGLPEINIVVVSDDFVMESWPVLQELYALSGVKAYIKTVRPQSWQDAMGKILSSDTDYDLMELDSANARIYNHKLLEVNQFLAGGAPSYLEWAMTMPSFEEQYSSGMPIVRFPLRVDSQTITGNAFVAPSAANKESFTLEEFYQYMKNGHIVCKGSTAELVDMFAPYFGTSTYWYFNKTSYVYGPVSEEFKYMLEELAKMYSLGIISGDYEYAPPSTFTESIVDTTALMALARESDYQWLYEMGYRPAMLNFVQGAYVPSASDEPSKYGSIMYGTGNEYNALAFLDTCFSDDGRELLNNGISDVHSTEHIDGVIEYMTPYTMSGDYQWRRQGLTPEGLPGVYYNSWAKFDVELLTDLTSIRKYQPSVDFLVAKDTVQYSLSQPKKQTKASIELIQYRWWTAFINGEKSVEYDWIEYVSELTNAGCYHGYLE